MMNPRCVVVDANIAFKALAAGRGDLRDRLGPGASVEFFSPRFLFVELFKHKERLARAANVTEKELLNAFAHAGEPGGVCERGEHSAGNLDGSVSAVPGSG
jgi:hypothetical protein